MLDRMLLAAGGEEKLYVEDVFSTYLYTGNGSTQTITNGIDLAGKGGLVWTKARSAANSNLLYDTARGATKYLSSNSTSASQTNSDTLASFNANGFTLGPSDGSNQSGTTGASWTFRKAPKFFDVVTYTGTGSAQTIAHNLGVAPGCIIVKRTDTTSNWAVYHRSNANTEYMVLNLAVAKAYGTTVWNSTAPTASVFSVGTNAMTNASGGTYVAYVFAHDAASDGIIQCGSFTTDGSGNSSVINLGWEPQWLLYKNASSAENWQILDTMRNWSNTSGSLLYPNLSNAEAAAWTTGYVPIYATGFKQTGLAASQTYIYIAIRRGPMKTPTSGTSVFSPVAVPANQSNYNIVTNFPVDLAIGATRSVGGASSVLDRLRGGNTSSTYRALYTQQTSAEESGSGSGVAFTYNDRIIDTNYLSGYSFTSVYWNFRRAPGFFDVVCYTGTGVARTINHNLGAAPELIIVKARSISTDWAVYAAPLGASGSLVLSNANPDYGETWWQATSPTSTTFRVNYQNPVNGNTVPYVAYLFASCPGVSKVGSFTGNGSSQTINCGFAAGARFVMIKRTDSTGDWYVWDTARGMVAGNDPHLSLNSIAAEVTTDDSVDTDNTGFIVNQVSATNVNVNGASYIYLAVA